MRSIFVVMCNRNARTVDRRDCDRVRLRENLRCPRDRSRRSGSECNHSRHDIASEERAGPARRIVMPSRRVGRVSLYCTFRDSYFLCQPFSGGNTIVLADLLGDVHPRNYPHQFTSRQMVFAAIPAVSWVTRLDSGRAARTTHTSSAGARVGIQRVAAEILAIHLLRRS